MSEVMITLKMIREHGPCEDGWRKLLAAKGKKQADDEPFPLADVLDSNGLDDCLWCLRCLGPEHHGWIRHYAVDCAEDVRHLMQDQRSLDALDVARRYADGLVSRRELAAAAEAAAEAAWAAARAAAWAAARTAAWETAAAEGAAWAAAAWATAAAEAAKAAAEAARTAAWATAWAAAREQQSTRLRQYLAKGARP